MYVNARCNPSFQLLRITNLSTGTWCLAIPTQGVPLLVLANKQDVPGAAGPAAVSTALGLNSMTSREFTIRGCSAIKDVGIQVSDCVC